MRQNSIHPRVEQIQPRVGRQIHEKVNTTKKPKRITKVSKRFDARMQDWAKTITDVARSRKAGSERGFNKPGSRNPKKLRTR